MATIFCFKIHSSKWDETTVKLSVHLCQMLSSLRNRILQTGHKCNTLSLEGIYFPKSDKEECVVVVEVKWSDKQLKFLETHKFVPDQDDIEGEVKEICNTNLAQWSKTEKPETDESTFSYPISTDYIERMISSDAKQTRSGQSAVIFAPSLNLAYMVNELFYVSSKSESPDSYSK